MRADYRITVDVRFEIDVQAEDSYDAEIVAERITQEVFYNSYGRASHITVDVPLVKQLPA